MSKIRRVFSFLVLSLLLFRILPGYAEEELKSLFLFLDDSSLQESQGVADPTKGMVIKVGSSYEGSYQYFVLSNPSRVVLDFSGLVTREGKILEVSNNPFIRNIRIGSHPSKTRVVFDLEAEAQDSFSVVEENKSVSFVFKQPEEGQKAAPQKEKAAPKLIGSLPLSLDRVIVYFKHHERPVQNIVVANQSRSPVLVWTKTQAVKKPGLQEENRSLTNRMLVSPQRFSLAPGSERTVRLVLDGRPTEKEDVYRVSFIPQMLDSEEPLDSINIKPQKQNPGIIAGVGILAFAEPQSIKEDLNWEKKDNVLKLTNDGNVNVLLAQGRMCVPEMEKCFQLPVTRLYAGNEWAIRVPHGSFLEFLKKVGEKKNELITISSS